MKIVKKNKFVYYIQGFSRTILPAQNNEKEILSLEKTLNKSDLNKVLQRVEYYNKLTPSHSISPSGTTINDLKTPINPKAYYFDTYQFARHFNPNLRIDFVFGDVYFNVPTPSIVKSRPLIDSSNSVLLNLDKARHFVFIQNDKPFLSKKNLLIGRAAIYQEHRYKFYEKYFNHPLCDIGQVNKKGGNPLWLKPKMPISQHLDYKFILSLQGTDVATNLKWIMSSNSLAVAPVPTLETWFMEGTLKGGEHFVEISPDYSNLQSQLEYYISHPKEAQEILQNAHNHCSQFSNPNIEKLTSLLVLKKYFDILNHF